MSTSFHDKKRRENYVLQKSPGRVEKQGCMCPLEPPRTAPLKMRFFQTLCTSICRYGWCLSEKTSSYCNIIISLGVKGQANWQQKFIKVFVTYLLYIFVKKPKNSWFSNAYTKEAYILSLV